MPRVHNRGRQEALLQHRHRLPADDPHLSPERQSTTSKINRVPEDLTAGNASKSVIRHRRGAARKRTFVKLQEERQLTPHVWTFYMLAVWLESGQSTRHT
jgi:hypothetical protein